MTTKEYLEQYKSAEYEINEMLEKVERLKSRAEKITPSYGGNIGVSSNINHDKIPAIVELIIEEEERTQKRISDLMNLQKSIQCTIAKVPDNKCRTVLIMKYIGGKSFAQIAVAMNYDYWHLTHRIHPKALKFIGNIME